ncbi:MAG: hypothetical protein ACJA14_002953, partial [Ilumatobacter sp.]
GELRLRRRVSARRRDAVRQGPEVGPVDVVASYHAGAVSAASRRADWTSPGSGAGAATQQFGSVRAETSCQRITLFYEVVIELNEYFASSHDHMVVAQNITV